MSESLEHDLEGRLAHIDYLEAKVKKLKVELWTTKAEVVQYRSGLEQIVLILGFGQCRHPEMDAIYKVARKTLLNL